MTDIDTQIEKLIDEVLSKVEAIDPHHHVITFLIDILDELRFDEQDCSEPNYPDDCYDEGQALASAGMGTDEDYGYFGEDEY